MTLLEHPAIRRASAVAFGALIALSVDVARAQEPALDGVGGSVGGFSAGDWFNLGWRLLLVVGVIWGAVWAMRWYVQRVNGSAATAGRQVQIIETRALGPNRSLQLVRLGGRAVLLGVTPDRINSLLEIDDPEEVARLADAAAASQARPRAVAGVFGALGALASLPAQLRARRTAAPTAEAEFYDDAASRERAPRADATRQSPARRAVASAALDATDSLDLTPLAAQQLQARAGYGSRAERIAELQRAIARARQESPR